VIVIVDLDSVVVAVAAAAVIAAMVATVLANNIKTVVHCALLKTIGTFQGQPLFANTMLVSSPLYTICVTMGHHMDHHRIMHKTPVP